MDVSRCAPSVLYAYDLGALWVSGWMPGPRTPPGAQSCADTPTRVRAHRRASPVNKAPSVQFSAIVAHTSLHWVIGRAELFAAVLETIARRDERSCHSRQRLVALNPCAPDGVPRPKRTENGRVHRRSLCPLSCAPPSTGAPLFSSSCAVGWSSVPACRRRRRAPSARRACGAAATPLSSIAASRSSSGSC